MEHRSKLSPIPVYANLKQKQILDTAAKKENRSTSNYLLNLGLQRAKELGLEVPGFRSGRLTEIIEELSDGSDS